MPREPSADRTVTSSTAGNTPPRLTWRRHRWVLGVCAAAAGVLGAGAFPPLDLAILGVVAAAFGLGAMGAARTRRGGAAVAACFALGYLGTLYLWSARFGLPAYLALTVSQASFLIPVGWVAAGRSRRPAWRWIAAVSGTWTLVEAVRARVPLGGFEWGQLGTTAHGLPLLPAASVVGTLGLTALLAALAASTVVAVRPARLPASAAAGGSGTLLRLRAPGVVLVLAATLVGIGSASWTTPTQRLTVAAVQVDPVCPGRYSVECPQERAEFFDRHLDATSEVSRRVNGVDLVLWGEGSLRGEPHEVGERLVGQGGRLPAPLLAGVTTPLPEDRFANRNLLFGQDGSLLGSYAKRQPVPFGEYVPARRWLGGIGDVGRFVPADMRPGTEPGQLPLGSVTIGTVSSWEVTFSRLVRDTGRLGEAVVTLTTQATYEQAPVSDQLLRVAQLRAAELQRPVLVAATTGRSAAIDATGRRVAESRLYGADVLVTEVEFTSGDTPFSRWGDLPVLIVMSLVLVAGSLRYPHQGAGSLDTSLMSPCLHPHGPSAPSVTYHVEPCRAPGRGEGHNGGPKGATAQAAAAATELT